MSQGWTPPPPDPQAGAGAQGAPGVDPRTGLPTGLSREEMKRWLLERLAAGETVAGLDRQTTIVTGGPGGGEALNLDLATLMAAARTRDPEAIRSAVLGGLAAAAAAAPEGGDSIRAHDPAFSEVDLLARAQAALGGVLAARAHGDPRFSARFLRPQLQYQEQMQMDFLARRGHRQVVEQFQVLSGVIESLGGSQAGGDHATVRFRVSGMAQVVDRKGKRAQGDRHPAEWHQKVVLGREPGGTTTPGSACPACSAPVGPVDWACGSCGNPVPPAPGDWLVQAFPPRDEPRRL